MFYVKEKVNPSTQITVELHDDNIFCICPECGDEVEIDLVGLFSTGEVDLYGTSVYCEKCSKLKFKDSSKADANI